MNNLLLFSDIDYLRSLAAERERRRWRHGFAITVLLSSAMWMLLYKGVTWLLS